MYHGIHDISNISNLLGGLMKKLIRCLFIVCILCFSISPVYARAGGGGGGSGAIRRTVESKTIITCLKQR